MVDIRVECLSHVDFDIKENQRFLADGQVIESFWPKNKDSGILFGASPEMGKVEGAREALSPIEQSRRQSKVLHGKHSSPRGPFVRGQ